MSRYVLNSDTSKAKKSALKKFGTIDINTSSMRGVIQIANYRQYALREEVDITFKGEIKAKVGSTSEWYNSDDIKKFGKRISKVKLNRFIRKSCFQDVSHRMNYFGIKVKYYYEIKKLTWI